MIEIRWHGRGGQGVVTVSELLARACIKDGFYAQHFPEFGPERRGAPVRSFTRISNERMELHCGVIYPDIVVVIDPKLLELKDWITQGEKENTKYIVNSTEVPDYLSSKNVYCVNAVEISEELFGKPFYNTPMLGAVIRVLGIPSMNRLKEVLSKKWQGDILEKNLKALEEGYKLI